MGVFDRKQSLYLFLELVRRPFYKLYLRRRRVRFNNLFIIGKPNIINKGRIFIGNNSRLVSSSKFYGEGIFPVSLYTINKDSEIIIGKNVTLHGTSIRANKRVKIGDNSVFAGNVKIIDHDHYLKLERRSDRDFPSEEIEIGNNVWVGYDVIILKGVKIGEGSVIGAKSLVNKDIPANSAAAGNPAKVVKKIK